MPDSFEEIGKKADKARNVDLDAVLQSYGCARDFKDKAKWRANKGVLSVNGQKFMNWIPGTGGGGAIDLVIHLQGIGFKEAVLWLYERFCSSFAQRPSPDHLTKRLELPHRCDRKLPQVQHYLINKRRIPKNLTENLITSEKLYADSRGNAVFLLLGKKKRVVGAELRGTGDTKWRGMARGSRKNSGCFYIVGANARKMILCESAIDAASCFAFHPEYTAVSTSGATASPAWLENFITEVSRFFDNQKAY